MKPRPISSDHPHHDAVMSWLQDRELKDRPLGDARSGKGGMAAIASTMNRLQEKCCVAFPHIDRTVIDDLVRKYVMPAAS